VLAAALAAVETTPQRRAPQRVPWRIPNMPTYARLAVAAVAVIAVGLVGLTLLQPRSSPGTGGSGGSPSPSPPASPSPSPTRSVAVNPSPYVAPELTGTFSSAVHGFSISYPEGWQTRAATEPWTTDGFLEFGGSSADFMYDPVRTDHLFLAVASQPLAGRAFANWASDVLAVEECTVSESVTIDGIEGILGDCAMAAVAAGDRGYAFVLYLSGDNPEFNDFYYLPWFAEEILPTVDLRPEDAVDTAP
jgi:hypothetical protein